MATSLAVASRTCRSPSSRRPARPRDVRAERAEQDVRERAVHRPAHHDREQRSRRADERARDDQRVVVEHEAGARGRQARERVQHRDHDRHVGAADGDDQQHSEQRARRRASATKSALALRRRRRGRRSGTGCRAAGRRSRTGCRGTRSAGRSSAPAASRTRSASPAKLIAPITHASSVGISVSSGMSPGVGNAVVVLRERDQRHRAAADAVEQRHHLRHRGHLHRARRDGPDRPCRSRCPTTIRP